MRRIGFFEAQIALDEGGLQACNSSPISSPTGSIFPRGSLSLKHARLSLHFGGKYLVACKLGKPKFFIPVGTKQIETAIGIDGFQTYQTKTMLMRATTFLR